MGLFGSSKDKGTTAGNSKVAGKGTNGWWTCLNCGANVNNRSTYCTSCGR